VPTRLRYDRKFGFFSPRLGVCAGEFGEKAVVTGGHEANHAAVCTDKAAIAGGVSLMDAAGAQGIPN
jgi:hypothetical protein